MYRRLWMFAVAMLMGLASGSAIAAQDASPAADGFITPDPAECTVEPRTVDEMRGLLATAAAGTAAASPEALPAGEPADDATVAAVTATLREVTACENANSFLQMFALYTDDYLARSLVAEDVNPEALSLFATPIAPQDADDRTSMAIRDVMILPDGRVSVLVIDRNPLGDNIESETTYVLVEQDGEWLVDDIITPEAAG